MICIVGADGFFGTYLQKHIVSLPSDEPIVALNHSPAIFSDKKNINNAVFELHDRESVRNAADIIASYSDVKIIFLASVHNPDIVKKDPVRAEYINTVCYENFLRNISRADVKKLIYASSDTVYGESVNGYVFSENDIPAPINIYGKQKLLAEEITKKYGYSVARYSYMCAPSITSRKKHFFDEISSKLKNGEKVYMLTNWVRNALSYDKASEITYNYLMKDIKEDTLNICADRAVSKYDIGLLIADFVGADSDLVIPCTKKELNIFSEKRADEILMSNSLSEKLGISKDTTLLF